MTTFHYNQYKIQHNHRGEHPHEHHSICHPHMNPKCNSVFTCRYNQFMRPVSADVLRDLQTHDEENLYKVCTKFIYLLSRLFLF